MKKAVVVVAKEPVAGKVKTRLCPPLSPADAATLYRSFIQDTFNKLSRLEGVAKGVAYTPPKARPLFSTFLPGDFCLFPQRGRGLGERLSNLFADLFDSGYTVALVMSSDCPTLPYAEIERGIAILSRDTTDLVLGPCPDGGYYIIGLKALHRGLFQGISWSTSRVLSETMAAARRLRLRAITLTPWYDVDTVRELSLLREELRFRASGDHHPAPETARFLKALEERGVLHV